MKIRSSKQLSNVHRFLLLILVLLVGAVFRFYQINWDQNFHLHPDERFLTMVESAISPVPSWSEYFDTHRSTLNPHNIVDANGNPSFPFFVYGTLPIILVRYLGELLNQTNYSQIHIIGRYLSGIFDLGTVLLVFLISKKVSKNNFWLSLTASFLYACAVLPIQIAHFYIVDHFTTFFSMASLLAAIHIAERPFNEYGGYEIVKKNHILSNWQGIFPYFIFAAAVGMASASKINAVVIAFMLPVAVMVQNNWKIVSLPDPRKREIIRNVICAAIISFLVFRFFQPYAFNGPGFLNFSINPKWISNLRELSVLSSGDSNYPPSLQWARRGLLFPIKNIVIWGLGIPTGVLAFLGIGILGWRIFKGENREYLLIWIWTILYLLWQLSLWNPTMRYFLLIYPTLAIIASWMTFQIFLYLKSDKSKNRFLSYFKTTKKILLLFIVFGGTFLWALAFMNIYTEPMTRIEASEWIYQNIESSFNLVIDDGHHTILHPLAYPHYLVLENDQSVQVEFASDFSGDFSTITIEEIEIVDNADEEGIATIRLYKPEKINQPVWETKISHSELIENSIQKLPLIVPIEPKIKVETGEELLLTIHYDSDNAKIKFRGHIRITIDRDRKSYQQAIYEFANYLRADQVHEIIFSPVASGQLIGIKIFRILNNSFQARNISLNATITENGSSEIIAEGSIASSFTKKVDFRGAPYQIGFNLPVVLDKTKKYTLSLEPLGADENTTLTFYGSQVAKETDWDDALPLYMNGFNPFDRNYGLFPSNLNFQMYWDDNSEKLERFVTNLELADYIIITSNRQWGSTTQIPERYPLTTFFYEELIGCSDQDVQDCYRLAAPGAYSGRLGFELEKTFYSFPKLFNLEFNSQFAEEAFTVYDHPKVFVFSKKENLSTSEIYERFASLNLEYVLPINPAEANDRPGSLMMTNAQKRQQRESGTWSDLFDYSSIQNSSMMITTLVWYGFICLLGWISYPILRLVFRGLPDHGFSIIKLASLLILSYFVWISGSLGISASRMTIAVVIAIFILVNVLIFISKKKEILHDLDSKKALFLFIEAISIILFLYFLLVRLGNPDLWHPYKGGEKPMDFSYLNAIIKSEFYPPYDPWYAGGYINYYYFGFLLASLPIKLLGIVPSIAYNLVLPTFFSFTGLAVFGLVFNVQQLRKLDSKSDPLKKKIFGLSPPYFSGLVAIFLVLFIGNLATAGMIISGFQQLGSNDALTSGDFNLIAKVGSVIRGIALFISGNKLNYYPGDWYWIPSRTIPGEPITEFPYFTFLYADPHAHLLAYPVTIMVLVWLLSIKECVYQKNKARLVINFLFGAIAVGSLRAMNTWDYPTLLLVSLICLFFVVYKYIVSNKDAIAVNWGGFKKVLIIFLSMLGFGLITYFIFFPYSKWFGQGYTSINLWKGDKTPIGSFLIHWGFFIFIIFSYLLLELRRWLVLTPLASLKKYYPYRRIYLLLLIIYTGIFSWLFFDGVEIASIVMPGILIAAFLLLVKPNPDELRYILFLTIIGLFIILGVEVVVLRGDIGRMNTVFKFYLQAWTFISLGAAVFLVDLSRTKLFLSKNHISRYWKGIFVFLFFSAALFPFTATLDKIHDRISKNIPVTLDGMEFMRFSTYPEGEKLMDLEQDYRAIRWMQENISGTPVIIEANTPEYRWGNRYTIYTGLPSVVGWNWHQRQQRTINPEEWVFNRIADIEKFYITQDIELASEIVKKYDVEYIVVGQLEEVLYDEAGIKKFADFNDQYWEQVYSYKDTTIYHVIE